MQMQGSMIYAAADKLYGASVLEARPAWFSCFDLWPGLLVLGGSTSGRACAMTAKLTGTISNLWAYGPDGLLHVRK